MSVNYAFYNVFIATYNLFSCSVQEKKSVHQGLVCNSLIFLLPQVVCIDCENSSDLDYQAVKQGATNKQISSLRNVKTLSNVQHHWVLKLVVCFFFFETTLFTVRFIRDRTIVIFVSDQEFHQLVKSWLIMTSCSPPEITKSFELRLKVGGGAGSNKVIYVGI